MLSEAVLTQIHDYAVDIISKDFKHMQQKHQGEVIYGFALGLVAEITGFFTACNTLTHLAKVVEEDEPDPWYIWGVSEWGDEGKHHSAALKALLANINDTYSRCDNDADYQVVQKQYAQTLINALQTCDKQALFGKGDARNTLAVYIQYVDAFDEDVDNTSFKRINPPALHEAFTLRWDDKNTDSLSHMLLKQI